MNAYDNFLQFFSTFNRDRLDGLSSSHFEPMTASERARAYDYLKELVETGGSEESVNGLFLADSEKAANYIKPLIGSGKLRPVAELCAAWNLYAISPEPELANLFAIHMRSPDKKTREKAAGWAPSDAPTPELVSSLQGMILTETAPLPLINAINKLLSIHKLDRETTDKNEFSFFYRGLRSDNENTKNATLDALNKKYPTS